MRLGDSTTIRDIEVIPTGSLSLDIALGVGGLPADVSLKFMDQNHPVKPP